MSIVLLSSRVNNAGSTHTVSSGSLGPFEKYESNLLLTRRHVFALVRSPFRLPPRKSRRGRFGEGGRVRTPVLENLPSGGSLSLSHWKVQKPDETPSPQDKRHPFSLRPKTLSVTPLLPRPLSSLPLPVSPKTKTPRESRRYRFMSCTVSRHKLLV